MRALVKVPASSVPRLDEASVRLLAAEHRPSAPASSTPTATRVRGGVWSFEGDCVVIRRFPFLSFRHGRGNRVGCSLSPKTSIPCSARPLWRWSARRLSNSGFFRLKISPSGTSTRRFSSVRFVVKVRGRLPVNTCQRHLHRPARQLFDDRRHWKRHHRRRLRHFRHRLFLIGRETLENGEQRKRGNLHLRKRDLRPSVHRGPLENQK